MARNYRKSEFDIAPLSSWISQHGWIVGVALIGGGLAHQYVAKNAAPSAQALATPASSTVVAPAAATGPFAIIAEALAGPRRQK
jgi:hypothetical protein